MRSGYLVDTIRATEAVALAALPPGALMQRAAVGLATCILRELRRVRGGAYRRRVLLVVGPGDNGGDALYAGVRLLARGVVVTAWRATTRVHPDGWRAFRDAGGREATALPEPGRFDLVVDGLFGIGGRPGLSGPAADFAEACRRSRVPVVAADLPSGLDADRPNTGAATSFCADVTVAFGGLKPCHLEEPARSRCGRIEVVDIGLALPGPELEEWEQAELAAAWPFPDATSDKYSRGVVGIDAGSRAYPGAAVLTVLGATHAGAGMIRFVGDPRAAELVRHAAPNVVHEPGRAQAWVLGPGWGPDEDGGRARRVAECLAAGLPVLLDADALRVLPSGPLGPHTLLTPHAGELARLLGVDREEVAADPVAAVRCAADARGCAVLLKGATQYVATPDTSTTRLALAGPAWSAQAGSGDVLAGVCGALLAAGLAPGDAALAGASAQASAALNRPGPYPPQSAVRALSDVVASSRSVRL